jgi:hypothetical protein
VLGWCSRLMEHDADLAACLADDGGFCPRRRDDFCHALVTVCGKGRESRLAQWLHPPLAERLAFLDRAGCDARVVAACRRRIWHITLAIGGCYAAAIAVLVF